MKTRAVVIFINILVCKMIFLHLKASNTLVPSQSISVGQTLMSTTQEFELGFFSPANSSTKFLGIWFKDVPETIVWVANRGNPLSVSDETARLMLSKDGNLGILDGNQQIIWSTNKSVQINNPIAVLSDTGDLIIKDNISGWVSWESFANPCDVFLMTMQLESNTKTGDNPFLSSWRSEVDPSVGEFTLGLLPQLPVQGFVWKGGAIYWRTGPWNGLNFVGIADTAVDYIDSWSIRQNQQTGTIYFSANEYEANTTTIFKLFPEGSLKLMDWVGDGWMVTWEAPQNPCDVYGMCGPFGVCNANESPICTCPRGFEPKSVEEWSKGDWSNGCVRRTQLLCSKNMSASLSLRKGRNSGFWKLRTMKVADNYQYIPSVDSQGCRERCMSNCLCTAYAYIGGIGCLVWNGDLIDMQEFSFSGEDLFIRLDQSELVESRKTIVIISLVSALFITIILCFLITSALHKVRNKQQKRRKGTLKHFFMGSSSDVEQLLNWKIILQDELTTFDFEDIVIATNDFAHSNKVGEGGFGAVFRGMLNDGQEIAVKRLSGRSGQGVNEFLNEILLISKLQHRNLVKILGCSIEGQEKLIVYEYLPNGSLDAFLFDSSKKNKLDWPTRFNIILGIARGISYLHRDSRLKVIHRDLKASNILLDDDLNSKISDFGLARTFQATQESANTCHVVGTYGYMSPEYALRGIFSEKSDVFSFGILLLEIISGNKINSFDNTDEPLGLLAYVMNTLSKLLYSISPTFLSMYFINLILSNLFQAWRLWNEGREMELMDESLVNVNSNQVTRCIKIGLLCVQDNADERPTMPTVILMLSSDMQIQQPKQPLFVPRSPLSDGCHPFELDRMYSANEITESLVEGR